MNRLKDIEEAVNNVLSIPPLGNMATRGQRLDYEERRTVASLKFLNVVTPERVRQLLDALKGSSLHPTTEQLDEALAERQYPSNPRNAARAGWYAALKAHGLFDKLPPNERPDPAMGAPMPPGHRPRG